MPISKRRNEIILFKSNGEKIIYHLIVSLESLFEGTVACYCCEMVY